ncbi:MAG: hypothetical protein COW71_10025 [Ignavibacteriales bacterium CG18_big_fil_WC_8_21_14_2_50_31_20]|nr:MAG: hypothetical protein COW71_10025 [Ignavibacteriales bacterium CG18_big_fil_WC_8_21_14_2_50_31_20]
MQKIILLSVLLLSTYIFAENYRKVKIDIINPSEIIELQKLGIPLEDAYKNRDGSIDIFLNEKEFTSLSSTNIKYDVVIDDWEEYYNQMKAQNTNKLNKPNIDAKYPVNGFTFGSMGGNYTLKEVWEKIDEMISNYPNLISVKDSIGASLENRPIYAVKISDNPNINEDEPEVLYTALIHAREPESMMQMFYFMYYLLENYGTEAEVTYLIDNREMYFIPVINPDGYAYNEAISPNGGGMWRKNRQYNSDGSHGVDLNRNFGYKWGYDNSGSSANPSSETYRGSSAFSEPETETIRQYCINHDFKLALNYHSYGNLLITPWGYIPKATPDSTFYSEIATDMTQFNNYQWGYSEAIIYSVNGDSDDWFYGDQSEKNKIFAMTPEIGNSSDGFWPIQDRIIPLAIENMYPNLYLAWVAGGFVNTLNHSFDKEYYSANDTGKISITLKNKGLGDIDNIKVVCSISENAELISNSNFNVGKILSRSDLFIDNIFEFQVKDSTHNGDSVFVEIKYFAADLLITTEDYSFILGTPKVHFIDSLNVLDNWTATSNGANNWELTSNSFSSAPFSVTDSKFGTYASNSKLSLTSKNEISLKKISNPFLKFKTKYSIESGWDYAQIMVSTDLVSWDVVGGDKAKYGSGNFQPSNELIYDGFQNDWITEVIDLKKFGNQQIYLRFELNSDEYAEEDGLYIDDVEIFSFSDEALSVNDNLEVPTEYLLSQNYPNPFNPSTKIIYSIPFALGLKHTSPLQNTVLKVYDILGREITTLVNKVQSAGNYEVVFDGKELPSGIYFYRIQSGNFTNSKKMLLLK